ncbi:type IV pilus biogenesis/stability protein PilW [Pseudomonas stutzeri]|nr:type IV pilus biogenesis/stability protein PilW [Stutzerimonas stutzeri]
MLLRTTMFLLLGGLLGGCVTTGNQDPLKTSEGRSGARDAYIQLGIGYLQAGSTEQAKVPLKQALTLDPANADAHAALALVFQTELEPKLADEHYRKALAARRDARILNNYGSFLFEQQRYREAYERFEQAAEDHLYPERSRVYENLGLTSLRLGQREQALEHFEKSLRLNRNQPRVLLEMAQLSFEERHYVPARGYYERFLGASRGAQDARSLLLGIRLATIFEDRDRASNYALQLRRLYPGTAEYRQYLAEQQ